MIYTELTKKALKISFNAHKDQTDKSGLPYIYHPFHLAEQMTDEYSICAALLHDVAEDTDITIEDIAAEGFPEEVIDALRLLTHDDSIPYLDYVRKIKTNSIASKVKLADLRHNSDLSRLDTVDEKAIKRVEKYLIAISILEKTGDIGSFKTVPAIKPLCCGMKIPADYAFCSQCGKKIESFEKTEMEFDADQTITECGKCSRKMLLSDRFCGHCGAKSHLW